MESKIQIRIPESLTEQIREYRRVVRWQKITEAIGFAVCSIVIGFLSVFSVDRFLDAGILIRLCSFFMVCVGVTSVPWAVRRWGIQLASLESTSKLLGRKLPGVGDGLLGALELAHSSREQQRSPVLCQAALEQVANETKKRNLLEALPRSNHVRWTAGAITAIASTLALALVTPEATRNAWSRSLFPFASIPRFTFTSFDNIPNELIVPHGETFSVDLQLSQNSQWFPHVARAKVGTGVTLESELNQNRYRFEVPPQLRTNPFQIRAGDSHPSIELIPSFRPELESLTATIQLPEYLNLSDRIKKDVRGGSITVLKGSKLNLDSKTSKPIAKAYLNGISLDIRNGHPTIPLVDVEDSMELELSWQDEEGLNAKAPFPLAIHAIDDEAPVVFGEGIPRNKVMLDSEQLQFTVRSVDDYGVRRIGMTWQTIPTDESSLSGEQQSGESILVAGAPDSVSLDAMATFHAPTLKIPSKPIELRFFAEDYKPGRDRIYSAPHILYLLTPNQHAVWILDQFNKWQQESMEVRDRELQLLAGNRQLRQLTEIELNTPEAKQRIEQQAAAEQSNGRRLNNLTAKGDELLRQAARNSEVGAGHLEQWAEMQQVLKDIAGNRMPSVAELLKQAARKDHLSQSGTSPANSTDNKAQGIDSKGLATTVQDASQQPMEEETPTPEEQGKQSPAPSLRLPGNSVASSQRSHDKKGDETSNQPSSNELEEAIAKQEALLAEFEKISDQIQQLLGNLEGSTLVKRLKAASREQLVIADQTSQTVDEAFGNSLNRLRSETQLRLHGLEQRENAAVDFISLIVDDMEGFNERRPSPKFEFVLEEMKKEDLLGNLRNLSSSILHNQGLAISDAEYWSDTIDRWAEDIVDPASKGEDKGQKNSSSLPPSVVLEVMKILEEEMNLRDRTRVSEQAKKAISQSEHRSQAEELARSQSDLQSRVMRVRETILALPNSEKEFGRELQLMENVTLVMFDATSVLAIPNTGKEAIAAETEAIELLLETKRNSQKKTQGGSGAMPGGGGQGTTEQPAIAMIGPGVNAQEQRDDHRVSQETGSQANPLPEEYRQGLDEYFQRIDRKTRP